eukprot:COSAG06_NODE_11928_length_1445_cov_16.507429_1_plen_31_part_10
MCGESKRRVRVWQSGLAVALVALIIVDEDDF